MTHDACDWVEGCVGRNPYRAVKLAILLKRLQRSYRGYFCFIYNVWWQDYVK